MNDISIKQRIEDSECVVIFTKGIAWGTMLANFVKTPDGVKFKTVVPRERVENVEYPWIESVLAEIYQTRFGMQISQTDITTVIALEKSITMGITIGNTLDTLAVESMDYMECPSNAIN